jgi:trehalose 6-phosphate phosphatase
MIPMLSAGAAPVLDEISRDRTLLAFDFDGTLAPIVGDRSAAAMRGSTRALLRTTALLYPCAVVSGRPRADVAARVAGVPVVAVIGNHGAEPGFGPVDRRVAGRVASWRSALETSLAGQRGVELEDKRFSVALHYRSAPSWTEAERAIARAVKALDAARVFHGNAVVNVVPAEAPTKGDAMRALCARLGMRMAVYVGDDRTDEEAFRSDAVRISIRVGECDESSARYCVPSQGEIDELLRAFVAARARQDGRGATWEALVRAAAR